MAGRTPDGTVPDDSNGETSLGDAHNRVVPNGANCFIFCNFCLWVTMVEGLVRGWSCRWVWGDECWSFLCEEGGVARCVICNDDKSEGKIMLVRKACSRELLVFKMRQANLDCFFFC